MTGENGDWKLGGTQYPTLELKGIAIGRNSDKVILEIPSLAIDRGERVALLGPSGCGKSTLLSTIGGLLKPISGEIRIYGEIHDIQWLKENTARSFQNFPVYPWLTVHEILMLACKIKQLDYSLDEIFSHLKEFSAEHLLHRRTSELSGGERCRVSIATAFFGNPVALFLDEPFTGLDTTTKESVSENIYIIAKNRNIPILLVTHDINDAVSLSDRVIIFRNDCGTTRICCEIPTEDSRALNKVKEQMKSVQ